MSGLQVVTGHNRRYIVAPLGNLVDERYTVYFNMDSKGNVEGPGGAVLQAHQAAAKR